MLVRARQISQVALVEAITGDCHGCASCDWPERRTEKVDGIFHIVKLDWIHFICCIRQRIETPQADGGSCRVLDARIYRHSHLNRPGVAALPH